MRRRRRPLGYYEDAPWRTSPLRTARARAARGASFSSRCSRGRRGLCAPTRTGAPSGRLGAGGRGVLRRAPILPPRLAEQLEDARGSSVSRGAQARIRPPPRRLRGAQASPRAEMQTHFQAGLLEAPASVPGSSQHQQNRCLRLPHICAPSQPPSFRPAHRTSPPALCQPQTRTTSARSQSPHSSR